MGTYKEPAGRSRKRHSGKAEEYGLEAQEFGQPKGPKGQSKARVADTDRDRN